MTSVGPAILHETAMQLADLAIGNQHDVDFFQSSLGRARLPLRTEARHGPRKPPARPGRRRSCAAGCAHCDSGQVSFSTPLIQRPEQTTKHLEARRRDPRSLRAPERLAPDRLNLQRSARLIIEQGRRSVGRPSLLFASSDRARRRSADRCPQAFAIAIVSSINSTVSCCNPSSARIAAVSRPPATTERPLKGMFQTSLRQRSSVEIVRHAANDPSNV